MRVTRTQGDVASSDIADPVFREMRGSLDLSFINQVESRPWA
jgi:hypothetical protein